MKLHVEHKVRIFLVKYTNPKNFIGLIDEDFGEAENNPTHITNIQLPEGLQILDYDYVATEDEFDKTEYIAVFVAGNIGNRRMSLINTLKTLEN